MALSEREQQMLDEMEQALYAEDPRFASQMQGTSASPEQRRRRIVGAVGTVVGLGLVILGISTSVWVGVGGFAVIVAALAYALAPHRESGLQVVASDGTLHAPTVQRAPRARRKPGAGSSSTRRARAPRQPRSGSFMQRLEQRWEDRRERGL